MATLFHDAAVTAKASLLELVNTPVRHWQLLILLDLLGSLRCDAIDGGACRVHHLLCCVHVTLYGRRSIVSCLRIIVQIAPLVVLRLLLVILIQRMRLSALALCIRHL